MWARRSQCDCGSSRRDRRRPRSKCSPGTFAQREYETNVQACRQPGEAGRHASPDSPWDVRAYIARIRACASWSPTIRGPRSTLPLTGGANQWRRCWGSREAVVVVRARREGPSRSSRASMRVCPLRVCCDVGREFRLFFNRPRACAPRLPSLANQTLSAKAPAAARVREIVRVP